jgi:hypothetical protein
MRNLRGWKPLMGLQAQRGQSRQGNYGQRPLRTLRQYSEEIKQMRDQYRQEIRSLWAKRLMGQLEVARERVDKRIKSLEKLYEGVAKQPGTSSATVDDFYQTDSSDDESDRLPTTRVMYSIFDELTDEDLTKDGYPEVSVVNEQLEEEGYQRSNQEEIRKLYDKWWHEKKKSSDTEGITDGNGHKPTQKVLFTIFEKIEGSKADHTEDNYPKVSSVNELLEKRNFLPATQRDIRRAYKVWTEENEE